MKDRKELIHALECVWAGVPDRLREAIGGPDSLRTRVISTIPVLPETLKKIKDILEAERAVQP